MYTVRFVRELSEEEVKRLIKNKKIVLSEHALFHIEGVQRKVFKEEELLLAIERELPRKVYLQENGRYVFYYRKKVGFRKLILEIDKEVCIVTFMDEVELPRIKEW